MSEYAQYYGPDDEAEIEQIIDEFDQYIIDDDDQDGKT